MRESEANPIETGPCLDCGHEQAGIPFCHSCGILRELPPRVDYFEALEMPRRFALEAETLQEAFHQANRRLHPDRFAGHSDEEKQCSLSWSSLANTAYRALKDPDARARYLLNLLGHTTNEAEKKKVPAELAEEYFEMQEALAEGDAEPLQALAERLKAIEERTGEVLNALRGECDVALAENADPQSPVFGRLAAKLREASYLRTMRTDLERRLG